MVLEPAADRDGGKRRQLPALGLIMCGLHQTRASHLKEILVLLAVLGETPRERVGQPQVRHDNPIKPALTRLGVGGCCGRRTRSVARSGDECMATYRSAEDWP